MGNFCEMVVADVENVAKGMRYDSRIWDKLLKSNCNDINAIEFKFKGKENETCIYHRIKRNTSKIWWI